MTVREPVAIDAGTIVSPNGHADTGRASDVTGDKDLLELESYRGLPILQPAEFLRRLNPPEDDG
jgi:predicted nucleic acid-binding protein